MTKKTTPVPPATPPAEAGTKIIVFMRMHPNYAYWPGDKADLADEHADFLLAGGFARPATEADEVSTPDTDTDETR